MGRTIICGKCGVTGHSKCPHCRSIFMDENLYSFISNVLTVKSETRDDGWHQHSFTFESPDSNPADELKRVAHSLREILENPKMDFEQLLCGHDWKHAFDCGFCGTAQEISVVPQDPCSFPICKSKVIAQKFACSTYCDQVCKDANHLLRAINAEDDEVITLDDKPEGCPDEVRTWGQHEVWAIWTDAKTDAFAAKRVEKEIPNG